MPDEAMAAAFEKAEREVRHLERNLGITNADHVVLWLDAHIDPAPEHLGWLACRIVEAHETRAAELEAKLARAKAFIRSIDDDWVKNEPAEEDEWNDGYVDCLAEYAKRARTLLKELTDEQ